jgi:hypothetical protein
MFDSYANISCSLLCQKLKVYSLHRNCVLFEVINPGRRLGLFEGWGDDEDSDEDPDEEPERVWLYPCPICGRRNEKVGNNLYSLGIRSIITFLCICFVSQNMGCIYICFFLLC